MNRCKALFRFYPGKVLCFMFDYWCSLLQFNRIGFVLLFLFVIHFSAECQSVSPWTGKVLNPAAGMVQMADGVFEGLPAKCGTLDNGRPEPHVCLPFVLVPCSSHSGAPTLIIFNGGPGDTNLRLSRDFQKLACHFHILLPGYRGVDDRTALFPVKTPHADHRQVGDDAARIVAALDIDTLVVAAHSFGTIYAREMLLSDTVSKHRISLFFSPLLTNDISVVVAGMEQMINNYFACSDDFPLLDRLCGEVAASGSPSRAAMGLVTMLGSQSNYAALRGKLGADNANLGLEAAFDAFAASVDLTDNQAKLNSFFGSSLQDADSLSPIAAALADYFSFVSGVPSSGSTIFFKPDRCFAGEFDFLRPAQAEILPGCGHSDVWMRAASVVLEECRKFDVVTNQ